MKQAAFNILFLISFLATLVICYLKPDDYSINETSQLKNLYKHLNEDAYLDDYPVIEYMGNLLDESRNPAVYDNAHENLSHQTIIYPKNLHENDQLRASLFSLTSITINT